MKESGNCFGFGFGFQDNTQAKKKNRVYENLYFTQPKYSSCVFYRVFESVMYNLVTIYLHIGNKYKE